jgi:hypothetical protein
MKKEYLLLIVAIVGLSALLFYQKQGKTNYQLPQLEVLKGEADRLVLEKGGERVELRRVDGRWVIEPQGWRANQERVENMVAELRKVKLGALVSEKKNYRLYELTPEKRVTAALYQGDRLLRQLAIGKCSRTFRQTYIMLKDDPRVYQALGNLKNNFFTSVSELRDKTVLKIGKEELAAIDEVVLEQEKGGRKETLKLVRAAAAAAGEKAGDAAKTDGGKDKKAAPAVWKLPDGKPAQAGAVKSLLQTLSHLECQNFIDDPGPEAFAKPAFRVVARGGGKEFWLALLPLKDGAYPARSSYVKEVFRLPKWRADRIVGDFSAYTGEKKQAASSKAAAAAGDKSGKKHPPAAEK